MYFIFTIEGREGERRWLKNSPLSWSLDPTNCSETTNPGLSGNQINRKMVKEIVKIQILFSEFLLSKINNPALPLITALWCIADFNLLEMHSYLKVFIWAAEKPTFSKLKLCWYFGKFNTPKFHSEITWPLARPASKGFVNFYMTFCKNVNKIPEDQWQRVFLYSNLWKTEIFFVS